MAWQAPMLSKGAFWIGADGNVYVAGAQGTHSAGVADNNTVSYWQKQGFGLINDPNPPQATTSTGGGPASSGGGGYGAADTSSGGTTVVSAPAAPVYQDKSGDIAVNNAGLASVDTQVNSGIAGVDKTLGNITGQYDTEKANNEGSYTTNSNQNQNNLQKNKQTAEINAASGRKGLFGTLASLGALNGDGINLANEAVQKGANEDLSGASDNYATNQQNLDTSIKAFRDADKARRDAALNEAENEKKSIQGQGDRDRQTYYKNIADDYRLEGKNADADKYVGLVNSLFPSIAQNSVPTTNLAPQAAAYTPASLASYLGNSNTQVKVAPNQSGAAGPAGLPGLVVSNDNKKNNGV